MLVERLQTVLSSDAALLVAAEGRAVKKMARYALISG